MKGRATPGSAAARRARPTTSVQAAPAEAQPADILIVDDTASNLQILSDMLKGEGYRTRAAVSGVAALRAAASQAPDLILLDIMMPEMDGYEVCRRLKAEARLKDVPVIFLSALSETEDKVRAFAAGGADYVTKPFQFDEVRARVAAHLRLRQQQLEIERSSEAKYRRLFETAKDGILLLDAEAGEITDVNPFLMDMLGCSHDELLGKHLWDIGLFEDVAAAEAALRTLREEGHVRCANLPLETRDGRSVRVEFVSSAYAVDGREVIQCSIRDITERVRAEAALREQEERIRQAYVDVIDAVTGGKLILLTEEALAGELGSPVGELVPITSPAAAGTGQTLPARCHRAAVPWLDTGRRPAQSRLRGVEQRAQARRRRHLSCLRHGDPAAGGRHRPWPRDRLQDAAEGHPCARLLDGRQPGHGFHDHAAALRARAAVHAPRPAPRSCSRCR